MNDRRVVGATAQRCPRLRDIVSAHRRQLLPEDRYPIDPWRIIEQGFSPRLLPQTETIFCSSNGYLGIRATPEEGKPAHESGTYLNGFYETWPISYGEEGHGFAKTGQTMLSVPDGTLLKLYVGDEPFELDKANILSFKRVLNMQAGVLTRDIEFATAEADRLAIHSTRFVSLEHRHLACLVYEVEMLEGSASIVVSSELVVPGEENRPPDGDPRHRHWLDGQPLVPTDRRAHDYRVLFNLQTCSSQLRMACAMDHVLDSDVAVEIQPAEVIEDRGRVVFLTELITGQKLRIIKYLSYHHSESADAGELRFRTNRSLDRALRDGFERVRTQHRERVTTFWEAADVVIEGDPEVQQAVRFNLFQILQATARVEDFGVPAKGLSGSGYEGHYFWDTEIYVLPFLSYTAPQVVRTLLTTRYRQLDQARARAREVGQRGALYPWRTINGNEASAYYAAGTAQYHINADIVFAAARYAEITGDEYFWRDGLTEMAVETARLWADLGFYSERKGGQFCINGVTGPDEYNTIVNNNAYTNFMAQENLRIAVRSVEWLRDNAPEDFTRLVQATELSLAEIDDWRKAADAMYLPYDEKMGVHLQDDDFLDHEIWDFAHTPADRYPLLLHYHPLVIYRHQVIKQADLVLATFLLGNQFSLQEKQRIYDYYDPLTTGDSSLSGCIQSLMATEVGYRGKAYEYFADAVAMDLGNIGGNVKDGLHIASLGGTWMALVFGFAGLRDHGGVLRFRPDLPDGWERLRFRLQVRDVVLQVDMQPARVEYRLLTGDQLDIIHDDATIHLTQAKPVELALPGHPPPSPT